MVSIENLAVEFSATPLFTDVNFVINPKDRIALVGKNGAGKSTMLKIIAGQQQPTHGTVAKQKDTTIGYLPQVMVISDQHTVVEEAQTAFTHIIQQQQRIDQLNQQLSQRTDYDTDEYMKLVEQYTHESDLFAMMGGNNYQAEIERTLIGLGFKREDFDRPTSQFSGGWRMRIELAKLLLQKPDLLLLDEPTNHLDIGSIQWLEQYLAQQANAVVLVSHDRAFINNVTNRTIEITCQHINDYKVKYDQYVQLKDERRQQQLKAYENQQKQIAELKDFIERFRYKPTKSNQVQSRIKQLEKIVPIQVDQVDNSQLHLKFPPCLRSGDYPVVCENTTKQYGTHTVFSDINLTIKRGEKIALVGNNGEGKSTLIKCIMNEIPYQGTLKIAQNTHIGYFAQNQAQLLDNNITVYDTIDREAKGDIRLKIRDILGAFMFGGEASDKYVKVLSGGERSRLAIIKLLLQPVNLLILDEPTNHLDMQSKDILKQAIQQFDGTAIIVSHDRDFLNGLVDKVYEIKQGKLHEHIEGINHYLNTQNNTTNAINNTITTATTSSNTQQAYQQQKQQNKEQRKLQKAVEQAEQKIINIEQQLSEIEQQLNNNQADNDTTIYQKYAQTKQQLAQAEQEWEQAINALQNPSGVSV